MTDVADTTATEPRLSIGAVSQATAIPVETLRTWERRYGFPAPERDEAGHRVYRLEVVERLRLIQQVLELGHRASQVVGAPARDLRRLLNTAHQPSDDPPAGAGPQAWAPAGNSDRDTTDDAADSLVQDQREIAAWLDATLRLDDQTLRSSLQRSWHRRGPLPFLERLLVPFLEEVGDAWFEGRIAVMHEHFASRHIGEFLRAQWEPQSAMARGPRAICATLPGEFHGLGLQMVAVVTAVAGFRVEGLAVDLTPAQLLELARARGATYLFVGISRAADRRTVRDDLQALVAALPPTLTLLLGGQGAPGRLEGAICLDSLGQLAGWAQRELHDRPSTPRQRDT